MPSLLPRPASLGGSGFGPPLHTPEARVMEAMRRAIPKLPEDMRKAFGELIHPSNLATLGAVIAVWAGSHAVGVGQLADLGLLTFGIITLGAMAFEVAGHLAKFARLSTGAKTHTELDQAATHLAEAVTILGVTLFAALVQKHAVRVGRVASIRIQRSAGRYFHLTAEEWFYQIGLARPSPRARQGLDATLRFLSSPELSRRLVAIDRSIRTSDVRGWLKAMDLSHSVGTRTFAQGEKVVGYMQLKPAILAKIQDEPARASEILAALKIEDLQVGRFFTKPGTATRSIGIRDQNRVFCEFEIQGSVRALESKAAGARDTWTVDDPRISGPGVVAWLNRVFVSGGSTQFLIPDVTVHVKSGAIRLVRAGAKVKN